MLRITTILWLAVTALRGQAVYSLDGRIVDDIRGEAIQNVRLVLSGDALREPLVAKTDAQGKFGVSVPAGRYRLYIEKAGFFPLPSEDVEVRAKADLGDITLIAKRSISGTVTWRNGEPAAGTVLMAFLTKEGKFTATPGEGLRTDERGMFQMDGLRPGRYIVSTLSSEVPGVVPRSIAPLVYPGLNGLDLVEATEHPRASIVFDERTGVDVEGKVPISANVPAGTSVTVDLKPPGGVPSSTIRAGGRAGETFRIRNVPAGNYQAIATRQFPAEVQFGVQSIQVGASPIRDFTIAIPDNVPLTGKVVVEQPEGPAPVAGVTVRAYSAKLDLAAPIGRSDAQGQFRVIATMTGEAYQLTLTGGPPDAYVGKVTQGERTLTVDPFVVTANGEPVQVLLKKDGGRINGQVPLKGGLFRPTYIVLAPKNRQAAHFFRTASGDRSGAFRIAGIAPGAYDLFAFDQESNYLGEESLQKYAARGVAVTVEPNAVLTVSLELANAR